jgi:threonine dehydrogenase-like Zn-dependent dehydrogenase
MHALPLRTKYLLLYTATVVGTHIVIALPGVPEPENAGARNFWMIVSALLLVFLWRGSALAWALCFLLNLLPLGLALFVLAGVPGPGVLAVFALGLVGLYALVRLVRIEPAPQHS